MTYPLLGLQILAKYHVAGRRKYIPVETVFCGSASRKENFNFELNERSQCEGWVEYLQRSPAGRRRRQKENPAPGG
jgi:hypothetical protein